jgi:hypothetical protein
MRPSLPASPFNRHRRHRSACLKGANRRHSAIPKRIKGASTAEYRLLGADLYAVVIRVLEIGLPVCPLLAGVFANRFTPVGTIGLGTRRGLGEWREEDPLYSAGKCSGSFFGASAHIDGQERHNQDHRPIHIPFQSRQWVTLPFRNGPYAHPIPFAASSASSRTLLALEAHHRRHQQNQQAVQLR